MRTLFKNKFKNYKLTEDEIRHSLHMQTLARLRPDRITYHDGWIPWTSLEKLVARNMIMDMPISKIMEIFPNFSVNLVNSAK